MRMPVDHEHVSGDFGRFLGGNSAVAKSAVARNSACMIFPSTNECGTVSGGDSDDDKTGTTLWFDKRHPESEANIVTVGEQRRSRGAWILVVALSALILVSVAPASAAPYPPVPPTGGVVTSAAQPVRVPSLSVGAIAPGSYPVQARTGARDEQPSGSSASVATPVALVIVVGLGGVAGVRALGRRGSEPV
ncbi:hypothetical protein ACQ7HM_01790 [Williamsia sp. MIQD14]|uniref:hypothetical protein n=1 Tax=Williamsia sp. MIQD14 TaxID=3425703 RepID=UPI003DA0F43B